MKESPAGASFEKQVHPRNTFHLFPAGDQNPFQEENVTGRILSLPKGIMGFPGGTVIKNLPSVQERWFHP